MLLIQRNSSTLYRENRLFVNVAAAFIQSRTRKITKVPPTTTVNDVHFISVAQHFMHDTLFSVYSLVSVIFDFMLI